MARCHNVMLLLDAAGGAAAGPIPVRRAALRLLIYLSGRFGLARVRWAFRFFDSLGARSRASRVSDFRELGARSWEDFEEELEARLGEAAPGAHLPGPAPRATHTHGALMETLLDYQWDRPEITSPAKPVLRSSGRRLLDVESEAAEAGAALGGFGNAVFLLAPCPHSQRELLQFVSGCEAQAQGPLPTPKQLMEKLLPRRVQEVMVTRKITLYWVDTTARAQLWESPDHLGYWTVCERLRHVGGAVLPAGTWCQGGVEAGEPPPSWAAALPAHSILNRLLYNPPEYEASFPRTEGTLFLPVEGKEIQETWAVTLEPLAMHQRHFQGPVRIFLSGTTSQWALPMGGTVGTDSWVLRSPGESESAPRTLFQQLVHRLSAGELHLVASVDPGDGWPPVTGVISPLSPDAATLTVFRTEAAASQRRFLQTAEAENPQDTVSLCSDVVGVVLSQMPGSLEEPATPAQPCPEWAQQEISRTAPWTAAVTESWFPRSNLSGASFDLMESFWLLQAAPPSKEEPSTIESELTGGLAQLYLRKAQGESAVSNPEDGKKKRGLPRTPVRQKMKTMCRSLKMLNYARLNIKAQKLHPHGSPEAAADRGLQQPAGGRSAGRLDHRRRTRRSSKPREFKTEEELQSYIQEKYRETVATGDIVVQPCAQSMISAIKAFLRSQGAQDLEMNCLQQVKNNVLKTSKSLRQNIGKNLDKEAKVRECQLQAFLRLELCLQCPTVRDSSGDVEQLVEEVADLLRTVCLTEDSAYLAAFLEEILGVYVDSIPETLGKLYDSLGIAIPQKLAGVLPTGFLSDDSVTQEGGSPLPPEPLPSGAGGTEAEQLQELRTRSARKRRKNALIRHKSIAEVSQNLRQIEIPKVPKAAAKHEQSHPALLQPPLPGRDTVQEVTKVRRNLFTQEISPSKRSARRGLPRSHSVSAVDGLRRKQDPVSGTRGHHRLLTRSVAETPEHKQISRRLLHRQVQARSSDAGPDVDVVEESPEKEIGVRRSPRVKQSALGRTESGPFYSASQPKSRTVQRAHSFQQSLSAQRENPPTQSLQSPKTLLFGATAGPSESAVRRKRPSGRTVDPAPPTGCQTPQKSSRRPPSPVRAAPGRRPRTPRTPRGTPQQPQKPPAARTPARQGLLQPLRDSPSLGQDSPSPPSPLGRPLLEGGNSPLASPLGKTPSRPGSQPLAFLQHLTWPPPSPESAPGPTRAGGLTAARCSLRSPPGAAASGEPPDSACTATAPPQKLQPPHLLGAPLGEEPVTDTATAASSPASAVGGASESPPRTASAQSPHPGDLGRTEPPTAPPGTSPRAKPDASPHRPPLAGARLRDASSPERGSLEGRPCSCPGTNAGTGGWRPRGSPGPGVRRGWRMSNPLLTASDEEPLAVPCDAEDETSHDFPTGGGEGLRPVSDPGTPPCWGPGSPLSPPDALRCAAHGGRRQAAARLPEAPAHPQAFEAELEPQAGGLPRLRIKRVDASLLAEAEPPRSDPSVAPAPGVPRGSKASGRPDTSYVSPPCLRLAHSSPGKNGGQTYICQSCTPTRCPPSTPSPFQADVGVPWTPSPKHSGKTTPDTIRDWPRRKRAVDGSLGACAGTDLAVGGSLLRPEGKELGIKALVLGDSELEGVCQLPDQSPPGAGASKAEAWGQSGRCSGKRLLSADEEAECRAKRACDQQGEDSEGLGEARSPVPSGDEEAWASGSTPPPGRAVRSCLSARGLQALTQSPLLFHGKAASQSQDAADEDSDVFPASAEDSPFSRAFSRTRPVSRTYSRKKLIS